MAYSLFTIVTRMIAISAHARPPRVTDTGQQLEPHSAPPRIAQASQSGIKKQGQCRVDLVSTKWRTRVVNKVVPLLKIGTSSVTIYLVRPHATLARASHIPNGLIWAGTKTESSRERVNPAPTHAHIHVHVVLHVPVAR